MTLNDILIVSDPDIDVDLYINDHCKLSVFVSTREEK